MKLHVCIAKYRLAPTKFSICLYDIKQCSLLLQNTPCIWSMETPLPNHTFALMVCTLWLGQPGSDLKLLNLSLYDLEWNSKNIIALTNLISINEPKYYWNKNRQVHVLWDIWCVLSVPSVYFSSKEALTVQHESLQLMNLRSGCRKTKSNGGYEGWWPH